jgi:hypothetical protein
MKILYPLAVVSLIAMGQGCSPRGSTERPESAAPSSREAKTNDAQPTAEEGTSIKRNGASVSALVESVSTLENDMYTLFVRLDSAVAIEGMDSPAVQGQWLNLTPGYLLDEKGEIDRSNDRNKRLMSLRSASQGDEFKGKITFEGKKGWVLLDVETR